MREIDKVCGVNDSTGTSVETFDKYYTVRLKCINCGHTWGACIDLGMLVTEYLEINGPHLLCDCCKCKNAEVIPWES